MRGIHYCSFIRLLVAVISLVSASVAHSSVVDSDWQRRLETEGLAAWDNYQQKNRYAQGVCRLEVHGNGPVKHVETELKINENCRLLRIAKLTANLTEIFGQNPQYWFHLKTGKDGAWILLELYRGDQLSGEKALFGIERIIKRDGCEIGDRPIRLSPDAHLLGEILRSEKNRITSVNRKEPGGRELIEVQFEANPNPDDGRKLEGGSLLLDPARAWLPLSQTARVRTGVASGTHSNEFEYSPGSQDLLRVVEQAEYIPFKGGETWRCKWIWNYDVHVPAHLPDAQEFTLSAFGLPEPMGVKWEKPTPRYVWFLMAASGFAAIAFLFRYLSRHRH